MKALGLNDQKLKDKIIRGMLVTKGIEAILRIEGPWKVESTEYSFEKYKIESCLYFFFAP